MSNFEYIKDGFPEFYKTTSNAESYVFKDIRASAFYIRLTLEAAVKWLFANAPILSHPYNPKGLGA